MVDIRPVRREDYESIAKELYENIRFADQLEMVQLHRDSWQYVLDSMLSSDILYQARDEAGRLLCLTGTAPIDGDLYSCVWCLGTKELSRHKRDFVAYGKILMKEFLACRHALKNYIGIENKEALTWIKHMGAEFMDPIKLGDGVFIPFAIRG